MGDGHGKWVMGDGHVMCVMCNHHVNVVHTAFYVELCPFVLQHPNWLVVSRYYVFIFTPTWERFPF